MQKIKEEKILKKDKIKSIGNRIRWFSRNMEWNIFFKYKRELQRPILKNNDVWL